MDKMADDRGCILSIFDRLLLNCLRDLPCHIDTTGRCMGKRMGNTAAVTDDVESIMTGHQVVIHFHLHVVEFYLHSIEKSVIIRRTRCHLIQGINHLDNTVQNPLRENQAQITGSRIEGWNRKRFIDSLLRASFSADQVSKTLLSFAILSPYSLEFLKGSEKCFATRRAKFVLWVCFAGSS